MKKHAKKKSGDDLQREDGEEMEERKKK